MTSAIIIDDEKNAIITLKNDLHTYCTEINVDATFTKAADALAYLKWNTPEIIFLDIDMPVMNGFDFLEAMDQPITSQIIFVSAYSEFAVKAFKVSALDYLLKPVEILELQAAIQKAARRRIDEQNMLFKNFIDNYRSGGQTGKVAVPVNDGHYLIDPAHVIYCKADGAYTEIVMDNEKSFLISKTLGRTQELMNAESFERVHQSYLVNIHHIKKFRKGESPVAIMSNNDVVKVSRFNKDRLSGILGIR